MRFLKQILTGYADIFQHMIIETMEVAAKPTPSPMPCGKGGRSINRQPNVSQGCSGGDIRKIGRQPNERPCGALVQTGRTHQALLGFEWLFNHS